MTDRDGYVSRGWVPIPRPKKKVKKWRWAVKGMGGWFVSDHFTEEKILALYAGCSLFHRIEETEKEFES
jgi:hypothetical protein